MYDSIHSRQHIAIIMNQLLLNMYIYIYTYFVRKQIAIIMNQLLLNRYIYIYTYMYTCYMQVCIIYTIPIYGNLILRNQVVTISDPNHSTLHFYPLQAMMGLSDMDHMVAEAVTSEQAGSPLELGHVPSRDLAQRQGANVYMGCRDPGASVLGS